MTNYEYGFLTKLAQTGRRQPGQTGPAINAHTRELQGDPLPKQEVAPAPQESWLDKVKAKATATGNYLNDHPIGTSVAAGGIVGGLTGLLYEALRKQRDSMDRKDYLKRFLVGALIGTGAGGATGVGIDQYRKSQPLPQPKL